MVFTPLKQNRIAVEIVSQLKAAILAGRFTPGERLPTERELTEQFKVSRVVVREAVRELEITGLVKILQGPNGGAYVTDLSFDHLNSAFLDLLHYSKLSVAELIRTRILIECEIVRSAASTVQAEFAQRLQNALEGRTKRTRFQLRFCVHPHSDPPHSGRNERESPVAGHCQLSFASTGEVILVVKPKSKSSTGRRNSGDHPRRPVP